MFQPLSDQDESIAQRVGSIALKFPERNALYVEGRFYSYKELFEIVNAVYAKIPSGKTYGRIGIYCSNDVYTYASILAIGLYGAAYVPLNRKFPPARNRKIVEECRLELILSAAENQELAEFSAGSEIILTTAPAEKNIETVKQVSQPVNYILFTSGSTAEPKGVPVTNNNLVNFFNYFLKEYHFNETDRFLQVYELTFDVSVFSFFIPLLTGGCCYILPEEGIRPFKIAEYLQKHRITVLSMVPGVLRYLEEYMHEMKFPDLKYSFFSGDALVHELAVKWSRAIPNAAIHNFYGPTETTIVCTRYIFNEQRSAEESVNGIVPLGKAFEGMSFIIVDENEQETEMGELCFSGGQVIPAYLNAANEEKFFIYGNKRYYKTGDLASVNKYGNLMFHGRTDSQVKINGYRVELQEVEHELKKNSGLSWIVLCFPEKGINRLLAFVQAENVDEQMLREKLSAAIPDYMIPHKFIPVDHFPLNVNGKTDRKALINAYI